jgi:hypothetical protein|tara:strand:- start:91 stop:441 length:351 start_codon:yes stop_codon:yes gene_type:complete
MKGYKCLSYPQLKLAAWQSMKNEYNRQMDPDDVTKEYCGLEKEDTVLFPIEMYMIHRHKQGVPCEAHARAFIITPMGKLCIDFKKELFDSLEVTELDGRHGTVELPEDVITLFSVK